MAGKLTDSRCRNVKGNGKIQKLSDGGGLYLPVTADGKKYWRLSYRFGGKQKTLALGVYPMVSLAEARQLKDDNKRLIKDGADPGLAKKMEKKQLQQDNESNSQIWCMSY